MTNGGVHGLLARAEAEIQSLSDFTLLHLPYQHYGDAAQRMASITRLIAEAIKISGESGSASSDSALSESPSENASTLVRRNAVLNEKVRQLIGSEHYWRDRAAQLERELAWAQQAMEKAIRQLRDQHDTLEKVMQKARDVDVMTDLHRTRGEG